LIAECHYTKLYRFGPDVSGDFGWKNRGSQSAVSFYKDNSTGSVRMISREHITNKLRMNQMVYPEEEASFTKKNAKMYSWTAFDATIAAEEEDVNKGQSAWLIKFSTEDLANEFADHFRNAMQMNAETGTGTNVDDAPQTSTPEIVDQPQGPDEVEKMTEVNEQKEEEENEEDRYKGWEQHEIDEDKARRAKALKDAESAKLFAGDGAAQTVSWNMDAFGGGDDTTNAVDNAFGNFNFEDQRGVDLEAESVLNRNKVDPTISFGIDNANENEQDLSNVTTRGGDDEANDNNGDGNTFGALGTNRFAFSSTKEEETEKQETTIGGTWAFDVNAGTKGNEASSWNLGGDSGDKNEADTGGWGDVGGGFSSVKTTEHFRNAMQLNAEMGIGTNVADTPQTSTPEIVDQPQGPAEVQKMKGNEVNEQKEEEQNEEEQFKGLEQPEIDDDKAAQTASRNMDAFGGGDDATNAMGNAFGVVNTDEKKVTGIKEESEPTIQRKAFIAKRRRR